MSIAVRRVVVVGAGILVSSALALLAFFTLVGLALSGDSFPHPDLRQGLALVFSFFADLGLFVSAVGILIGSIRWAIRGRMTAGVRRAVIVSAGILVSSEVALLAGTFQFGGNPDQVQALCLWLVATGILIGSIIWASRVRKEDPTSATLDALLHQSTHATASGHENGSPSALPAAAPLPPADLLPVGRQANLPYRVVRLLGTPLLRAFFRIRLTGCDNIPRHGPFIVIANHLNWLDSFTIQLAFPAEPRLHFLAAPDLLVKRRLQWWIVRKTGGYVPVDRRKHFDTALFRHVYRCLELGGGVVIFPEANYGQLEGELLPFRNGFAHFALRSGAPVVPVALGGTKDLWLRKRIRVAIGRPIQPAGMDVESLVSTGRESITNLLPAYLEPAGPKLLRRWLTNLF